MGHSPRPGSCPKFDGQHGVVPFVEGAEVRKIKGMARLIVAITLAVAGVAACSLQIVAKIPLW